MDPGRGLQGPARSAVLRQEGRPLITGPKIRLFLCGASLLLWELILIRWLSSCVRVVGYYTNFVLIAAFFGLGVGALLARFSVRLQRLVFPALALCVLAGHVLSLHSSGNPGDASEYVWGGSPYGVTLDKTMLGHLVVPFWVVLAAVYVITAAAFTVFGQWVGNLFRGLPPVQAYTVEVSGSLFGILLFALMSSFQLAPVAWMAAGTLLLFPILDRSKVDYATAAVCTALMLVSTAWASTGLIWSPYYKIRIEPITSVSDPVTKQTHSFGQPVGHALTVNNDYHQMMLGLRPRGGPEHRFLTEWRSLYEAPYRTDLQAPPGPILVVGAGTGNDVMAALRRTKREIYAVDIDPAIVALGRKLHPESPYSDPRVHVVIDDARSFFQKTEKRFAMVVFGYLDSHTLLSSFSSLRLDNFVYTAEAMQQVNRILLPGGQVSLTFCTTTPWLHERFVRLLDDAFHAPTSVIMSEKGSYVYGMVYQNAKAMTENASMPAADPSLHNTPTDNWPFLYLSGNHVPSHYRVFLALIVALGFLPLLLLPRGQRSIKLPYFFMGAAFFLLETSNIVSLSLLFGSTWIVNAMVFAGILALVLLGNLAALTMQKKRFPIIFAGIGLSLLVGYLTPVSSLLAVPGRWLQIVAGVLIFLGPVFFAAVAFALLIRDEERFYQAYGSNILGAVLGGALEYLSLMFGFKFLLIVTAVCYLAAFVTLKRHATAAPA